MNLWKPILLSLTTVTLAVPSARSSIYDVSGSDDVEAAAQTTLELGKGFDPRFPDNRILTQCLEYDGVEYTGSIGTTSEIVFFSSQEEVERNSEFYFEIFASTPTWYFDFDFLNRKHFEQSEDSLSAEIRVFVKLQDEAVTNPRIRPEYAGLVGEALWSTCGYEAVTKVGKGALLVIHMDFENLTTDTRNELRTCLEAGYGNVDLATCYEDIMDQQSRQAYGKVTVSSLGVPLPILARVQEDLDTTITNYVDVNDVVAQFIADMGNALATDPDGIHATARPLRFETSSWVNDINTINFEQWQLRMKEFMVELARVQTQIERIDGLFRDDAECMVRGLSQIEKDVLLTRKDELLQFRDVIATTAARCWANTEFNQVNPSDPGHFSQACSRGQDYADWEAHFVNYPIQWPVALLLLDNFTFCQWCNRVDSTILSAELKLLTRQLITMVGLNPDAYACIEAEDRLLSRDQVTLPMGAFNDLTPLTSISKTFDPDGNRQTLLEDLDLGGNDFSDLSGIAGFPDLKFLKIPNGTATSLNGLEGLTKLRHFVFTGRDSTNPLQVQDWEPVSNYRYLEHFNVEKTNFRDVSLLSHKPLMNFLDVSNTQISSLNPLADHAILLQHCDIGNTPMIINHTGLQNLAEAVRSRIDARAYLAPGGLADLVLADSTLRRRYVTAAKRYFAVSTLPQVRAAFLEEFASGVGNDFDGLGKNGYFITDDCEFAAPWNSWLHHDDQCYRYNKRLEFCRRFLWDLEDNGIRRAVDLSAEIHMLDQFHSGQGYKN